jgi:hypothetical protein
MSYPTEQELRDAFAHVAAANEVAQREHAADLNQIIEHGREEFSDFDEACDRLADGMGRGPEFEEMKTALRSIDLPAAVAMKLADNPADMAKFRGLPLARKIYALADYEKRIDPNRSYTNIPSAEPAYKGRTKTRSIEELAADTSTGSDKTFERRVMSEARKAGISPTEYLLRRR